MYSYKDKLVAIAGASSGLGKQLAYKFKEKGACLALVARRAHLLDELAMQLDPGGQSVKSFPLDLIDINKIPTLMENIIGHFQRPIDVLVHCAGMCCCGEIERTPHEAVEQLAILNYLSGVRLTQCVLGAMKQQKSGQIIWIGSGSAFRGIPRAAAYCASKSAAKTFCEALRTELYGFGIDVILVVPGAMDTDFYQQQTNYSQEYPLQRTGVPSSAKNIADSIVKAGERKKSVLICGNYARIGRHLAYWAPQLLDQLYRRQL